MTGTRSQSVAELIQLMTLQREQDREDRIERRELEERREEQRERQRREELEDRANKERVQKEEQEKHRLEMKEEQERQRIEMREEQERQRQQERTERAEQALQRQEEIAEQERQRQRDREQHERQCREEREEREVQRREDREQARQTQITVAATLTQQQNLQERTLEAARTKRIRMGTDIPVLPKLTDPPQMELFLDQFRKDMLTYAVPPAQWTATLRPLLDEKSIAYSRHLTQPIQEDFDLLSGELLRLHGITAEFHGHNWKTMTRTQGEDDLQWNVRLGFAVRAWLRDCADREEVMDRLQMENQAWTQTRRGGFGISYPDPVTKPPV